ncbi:hypothetical protein [Adhaeretor mobilis]|uniref:Flagellar protein FliL n=1 Tax=Adhaeretor mobilis TaxID=1930276 RepID=A0A517N2L0_9BACT|nr:hypothetical protein [Adhaeretor mobilis]QDT01379.1 hypothetical protein HG15A2_47210 [Adhaeretor mobilis]
MTFETKLHRTAPLGFCKLLLTVLVFSQPVALARAAENDGASTKDTATATSGVEAGAEGEEQEERPAYATFDLGEFRLKEFRPTRNETSRVLFAVSLKLNEGTSPRTIEQLANWKQRLRNEALTAVRSLELASYQEPSLHRLQNVILLRINRLLPVPLVERIFVTEFTVGDH